MATIAEILLSQGQRQADLRRQQGARSGQMFADLGNIAGNAITQHFQAKADAPRIAQENRVRELQLGELEAGVAAREEGRRADATVQGLMPLALKETADGVMTFDRDLLTKELTTAGLADRLPEILKGLDQADMIAMQLRNAKLELSQSGIKQMLTMAAMTGGTPQALQAAGQYVVANGFASESEVKGYLDQIGDDPAKARQMIQSLLGTPEVKTREIKVRNPDGTETIQVVEDTPGQTFTSTPEPKPEEGTYVTVRGPGGRPVRKWVPREQMAAGVEEYQAPTQGAAPSFQRIETVDEAGNPVIQFMTPEEVRAQGGIRTSPKTTAKASGPATVDAILGEIQTLSEKINTSGGGPMSNLTGALRRGAAASNLDNDVSEYLALVEGFIPMVARAVGHSGVLTQQDVDSVRALFPRPGDNAELSKNKLERVKRIMQQMQSPGEPSGRASGAGPARGGGAPAPMSAEALIKKYGGG